jgi:hypothetical protein
MKEMNNKQQCGICGSGNLQSLAVTPRSDATIICHECGAKWWRRWYTKKEWDRFINTDPVD